LPFARIVILGSRGGLQMSGRLAGKVAIVTGAGSIGPGWGNGKATAVLFAREGAKVLAVDRNPAAAEETRAIIAGEGGTCEAFTADVSKAVEVEALVKRCVSAFGTVDILHNNVGILSLGGPVELAEADWDKLVAVNLKSMYLTCKYVLPIFDAKGSGAIVNIGSVAGIRHLGVSYVAYSTTKGAVLAFTRSVALQYAAKGIRANTILPGLMDTPMVEATLPGAYAQGNMEKMKAIRHAQCPMGRMGDAWDIARAALFLASDDARYITGAELVVDGGLTCKVA
jgi:NAD(P)-dependent dehydrogenase (short-subunit alcohol dehydrogenase family)